MSESQPLTSAMEEEPCALDCLQPPWKSRSDFVFVGILLGSGCFGRVYKAQHRVDKSYCAIKQVGVKKALRHYGGDLGKLLREVTLIQNINHENVVRYYHCFVEGPDGSTSVCLDNLSVLSSSPDVQDDTSLFIPMELCDSTLHEWLKSNPTLENRAPELPQLFIQLAQGLEATHEHVIHRDLKPDNIFYKIVEKQGRNGQRVTYFLWKIGDFGLCCPNDSSMESTRTGSFFYRSPDAQTTAKSDVYTLALIMIQVFLYPMDLKSKFYDMQHYKEKNRGEKYHQTEVRKLLGGLGHDEECQLICEMVNPDPNLRLDSTQVKDRLKRMYAASPKPQIPPVQCRPGKTCFGKQNMTRYALGCLSILLLLGSLVGLLSLFTNQHTPYNTHNVTTTTPQPFVSTTKITTTSPTTTTTPSTTTKAPPVTTTTEPPTPLLPAATTLDQLRGMKINRNIHLSKVTIHWKQGSILGWGGDEIHDYDIYVYTFEKSGANVLMFVQDDIAAPESMIISNILQYGCQNGEVFLVLHNKSRRPYQFRFVENKNALAGWAVFANKQIKSFLNYDASWIAGDYLRDF